MRQLTFEYTCQLTAFYGAQRAYGTARLSKTNSLVIHVVGARQAETLDLTRWEIFCYQLPKLLNLIVVFIGPELVWVKTYFSIIYFWLRSIRAVIGSANLLCNNFFFEALNFQRSKWCSNMFVFSISYTVLFSSWVSTMIWIPFPFYCFFPLDLSFQLCNILSYCDHVVDCFRYFYEKSAFKCNSMFL